MSTKPPPIEIDGADFLVELNAAHERGYLEAKAGKKMSVPAKEQPGEQNAAPQAKDENGKGYEQSETAQGATASASNIMAHEQRIASRKPVDASEPAVAAPSIEVAEIENALKIYAEFFVTDDGDKIIGLHNRPYVSEAHRNAIAALLAKLGQGWIPVSERLPSESDDIVVVQDVDGQLGFGYSEKGKFVEASDGGLEELVRWMPLPPPPERP